MKTSKMANYLDGFLTIYRPDMSNKSHFGAKKNITSIEGMEIIYKLAFAQSYKRLEDMEFAESNGRSLTLKVKVRLVRGIKNSDKVVIGNTLYDIMYLDEDRNKKELYLYLEEVRSLE